MRRVLFLARTDLWKGLRAREVLVWTFAMPILFFFFFSRMGGGAGSRGSGDTLRLESAGPGGVLALELERRLEDEDFALERAVPGEVPEREPRRVLEVPADLTARALAGQTTTLRLRRASEGFSADFDDVRVGRALYTALLDLAVLRAAGEPIEAASFARLREAPRALALDVRPAGERRTPPSGKQQSIPGTMVMFTLILLLTGGSVPIVLERRAGLLRRLASTPIGRGEIVAGRWLSNFALGLIQLAWALVIGTLLFDMDWGPHPVAVALVLVPWAGLCSGFALVLSSLSRSEGQVVGVGVLASNLLAALGGCWWPIEIAPGWMQALARLLPTGWIMDALHELINFQHAPASVWPQALALALGALVATWVGARLFRYE
jgi:ABC-2 type transport system permease protein